MADVDIVLYLWN